MLSAPLIHYASGSDHRFSSGGRITFRSTLLLLVTVLVAQSTLTAQPPDRGQIHQTPAKTIARLKEELGEAKAQAAKALVEARRARDVAENERAIAEKARRQAEVERVRAIASQKEAQQQRLLAVKARQEAVEEAKRARNAEAKAREQAERAIKASKQARTAEADNEKVKALKKKRLAVLQQIVALSRKAFEVGQGSLEQILQSSQQLAKAELEVATTGNQRLTNWVSPTPAQRCPCDCYCHDCNLDCLVPKSEKSRQMGDPMWNHSGNRSLADRRFCRSHQCLPSKKGI